MIQRLADIQNFTTTNINRLQYEVNQTLSITNSVSLVMLYDQHFFKINHIIDELHIHLKDITEIVQMSRHQIISRHLLNHNEIQYIINIFYKNNVRIEHESSIYELITLKGYYNNTNIIFSIDIPHFTTELFNYYEFKVIPNQNKIIYPVPTNEIALSTQNFQFITKPCNQIRNQYFCEKTQISPIRDTCIPAIISQLPAKCFFQLIIRTMEIDYIQYGKLYVQPVTPMEYSSDCNQETKQINEQTLISFNDCTITINNTTFTTKNKIMKGNYSIHMPFNDIEIMSVKPMIQLETLQNDTIQNMEEIKLLQNNQIFHTSSGHISLFFIITVIISYIIFKLGMKKPAKTKIIIPTDTVPAYSQQADTTLRGEESYPPTSITVPVGRFTDTTTKPFTLLADNDTK